MRSGPGLKPAAIRSEPSIARSRSVWGDMRSFSTRARKRSASSSVRSTTFGCRSASRCAARSSASSSPCCARKRRPERCRRSGTSAPRSSAGRGAAGARGTAAVPARGRDAGPLPSVLLDARRLGFRRDRAGGPALILERRRPRLPRPGRPRRRARRAAAAACRRLHEADGGRVLRDQVLEHACVAGDPQRLRGMYRPAAGARVRRDRPRKGRLRRVRPRRARRSARAPARRLAVSSAGSRSSSTRSAGRERCGADLGEARRRNGLQDAVAQVLLAAERIDDLTVGEALRDRVDREVAPAHVLQRNVC